MKQIMLRGHQKPGVARRLFWQKGFLAALLAGTALSGPAWANTLPTGGDVVAGQGAIAQDGAAMTITQATDQMTINWQSFSIGAGNSVTFVQPSASSVALNRVLGADVSVIQGALTANGHVFLTNPNGILFSPTAQVNVGGLVASTLSLSDEDFMAGRYDFSGTSQNAITNQGQITAPGGTIALIAARIVNEGTLEATGGAVLLGAGSRVTLDLGGPVPLEVDNNTLETLIDNGGAIRADGGVVWLTSQAADSLTSSVINTTGLIAAQTLETGENGEIILFAHGGTAQVGGVLDASAPAGGDGGFIETSGKTVRISDKARITTLAPSGQTGKWLIDPNDFTVAASGGDMTGAAVTAALTTTNFEIETDTMGTADGNGNIFINDAISWAANTLTLTAERDININAVMSATGTAGLTMTTDEDGFIRAGFGEGNTFAGKVDMAATTNLTINGDVYTIVTDWAGLQAMSVGLMGHYALGNDIVGDVFTPIGNSAFNFFNGTFDGLGHVVSGLTYNNPDQQNVGLMGYATNAVFRNVGLTEVDITANGRVGALVGTGDGLTINNVFATGSVTHGTGEFTSHFGGLVGTFGTARSYIGNSYADVTVNGRNNSGGLAGTLRNVYVENSFATGNVTGRSWVGGFAGELDDNSTLTNSYATGTVTANEDYAGGLIGAINQSFVLESYATGNVTNLTGYGAGGLAAEAWGAVIENSYATGAVSGHNLTAGLIGGTDSSITNSYAIGLVTATGTSFGGLVAETSEPDFITNSFWDTETSGQETSAGGIGKRTDEMSDPSTFAEWDIVESSSAPAGPPTFASGGGHIWTMRPVGGGGGGGGGSGGSDGGSSGNTTTTPHVQVARSVAIQGAVPQTPSAARASAPQPHASLPVASPPVQGTVSTNSGLRFVEVSAGPSTPTSEGGEASAQEGASPAVPSTEGGMDASGFMRVFVVNGGIRLPEATSEPSGEETTQ